MISAANLIFHVWNRVFLRTWPANYTRTQFEQKAYLFQSLNAIVFIFTCYEPQCFSLIAKACGIHSLSCFIRVS